MESGADVVLQDMKQLQVQEVGKTKKPNMPTREEKEETPQIYNVTEAEEMRKK